MYVIDHKVNKCLYGIRDHLLSLYLVHLGKSFVNITPNKKTLATKAISCILLNITYTGVDTKVPISLDQSVYSNYVLLCNGRKVNRSISYTYVRSVLDFLVFYGYIKLTVGGFTGDNTDYGFVKGKWVPVSFGRSYFEVLTKLKDIYPEEVVPLKIANIMRLKDSDKKPIPYAKLPPHMKPVFEYQDNYNTFSFKFEITVDKKVYYVQAHKTYNTSFNLGGRSYMEGSETIQSLSKEKRSRVRIDGMSCHCLDYKAFEPSLLYTMRQEVVGFDDHYMINLPEYDSVLLRKICKGVLLRMLNCESKESAYKACRSYIKDEYGVQSLYESGLIPEARIDVMTIIDMLEQKHYLIKADFYKGIGSELQYAGSLINDYLLDYFMQRGILVVQVHDAFIVEKEHEEALEQCMKRAFVDVFGFDDNVKITKEF